MTLQLPSADPSQLDAIENAIGVSWASPATGLWVASFRGEHAGMIERSDGQYHARSARGRALGSFEDLDSARAVIAGGVDEPQGAPRGVMAVLWGVNVAAAVAAAGLALFLLGN
jgi:hypothetical protein